jgi:predicted protein tyrosine phosphatase
VCTGNSERSPTAEKYFRNWKGVWETKSAGIRPVDGGTPLTQELVSWADLVVCMEQEHYEFLQMYFKLSQDKVKIANIADRYSRDDPELVRQLERKVTPMLGTKPA